MVLIVRCCEELGEMWIFPRFCFYSLPCGILFQAFVFALLCESQERVRAEEAELVLGLVWDLGRGVGQAGKGLSPGGGGG